MILPALWLTQEQEGWVPAEAIAYIADRIGTFASQVYEAATFYTMYNLHPVGRNHICICRTLSCWLRGKQEIVDYLANEIGIRPVRSLKTAGSVSKRLNVSATAALRRLFRSTANSMKTWMSKTENSS